jgi:hypothetical protein
VNRIVFQGPDVILVLVQSGNLYPHPFDFTIQPIGLLRRKAEEEFHVRANRQITPDLFCWWIHVVAVLRHPQGIF